MTATQQPAPSASAAAKRDRTRPPKLGWRSLRYVCQNLARKDAKRIAGGLALAFVTGRANYAAVSKAFGEDFTAHPERLAQSPLSELVSGWWWQTHGCHELADSRDFVALTRRINGGTNGLSDRIELHRRAKRVARWLVPER